MAGRYQKREKYNWNLILFLSGMVVGCAIAAVFFQIPRETALPTETVPHTQQATQTTVDAETEMHPTEPSQPSTETKAQETTLPTESITVEQPTEGLSAQQPPMLTALLEAGNIRYEELEQTGCSQLVTVASQGTSAHIRFFTCVDGVWEELPELSCHGHVGWNGVSTDKQEGDGCTPSGLYGIGSAFYIANLPSTDLDVFQITEDTYWVDDPNSAFYNQRVEGTQDMDWSSAEHMISYDAYRYGFVVEYNLQAQKGKGSAIFFHVGDNSTVGCVATDEYMVRGYLKELDKERNPHILIVNGDDL